MKDKDSLLNLLAKSNNEMAKEIGVANRNGQTIQAIKKTLIWVLK